MGVGEKPFQAPIRTGVPAPIELAANRALVIRALLATLILIASFFSGVVPAKAALIIAGLLLLTRRVWRTSQRR